VSPTKPKKTQSANFWLAKATKTTTALTTSSSFQLNHAPAPPTPPTTLTPTVVKSIDDSPCEHVTAAVGNEAGDHDDADTSNPSNSPKGSVINSDSDDYDYFLKQDDLDLPTTPITPKDCTISADVPTNLPTISMTIEESMQEAWESYIERSEDNLDNSDEFHRAYDRVRGIRLPQCTWALLDKPNLFGKSSGPLLMLTTPEGDIKYPQDMKYYQGAFDWADDSDEDDEEEQRNEEQKLNEKIGEDSDAYYASLSPLANKAT
jgi:hypothetical protein